MGSDTDTDTDTDAQEQGPPSFELLVNREDASGWRRNYRFQVTEGVTDGLILAHDGTEPLNWQPTPIFGHRVIYRTNGNGGEAELRLGTLDDPLPAETTRLDAPGKGGSGLLSLPLSARDGEIVIYTEESTLYRVDLDGLEASAPVGIATLGASPYSDGVGLDPLGRYVLANVASEGGGSNIGRISLDDNVMTLVSDVEATGYARLPVLSVSGDRGFLLMNEDGQTQSVVFVDLASGEPSPPVSLVSDVAPPAEIDWWYPASLVRPHAEAMGIVVGIGTKFDIQLSYYGVEDGSALPPVALHDPEVHGEVLLWAPDGRDLLFLTSDESDTYQVWHAHFADGHAPSIVSLGEPVEYLRIPTFAWSSQNEELYAARLSDAEQQWNVERQRVVDGVLSEPEHLAGPFRSISFEDIRRDGSMLLISATVDEAEDRQVYGIDLSSDAPQEPVLLSARSQPGEASLFASFSPDGRVVAYAARTGIGSGSTRLMLVEVETPSAAYEVADGLSGDSWTFIEADSRADEADAPGDRWRLDRRR